MAAKPDSGGGVLADINIVPFVDVVLVLLIIFLVTARFIMTPAIKVELPKALSEDTLDQDRPTLSILMGKDGAIYFSGVMSQVDGAESVAVPPAEVEATLARVLARLPNVQVAIQADMAVPHGRVIGLIDRLKRGGITSYAFNVDPAAADIFLSPPAPAAPGP